VPGTTSADPGGAAPIFGSQPWQGLPATVTAVKPIEDWPQQRRLTDPANQPGTGNGADADDHSASPRTQGASEEPNKQGRK
jgi:hypothetical protein